MIHVHDLEAAFVGALIAQIGEPEARFTMEDFDPGSMSGFVGRSVVQTLSGLVSDRGMGLTPAEARRVLYAGLSAQPEAIEWLMGLDQKAGESADLSKLARQITIHRVAQEAEAVFLSARIDPDNLDEDLSRVLSEVAVLLSRVADERYKVETLSPYLRAYEQGEPVIPKALSESVVVFGVPELDDPDTGIITARGGLGVIAAPPTWGKSVMVSQLAGQTALAGRHVLVASLEQGRAQVAMRSIASLVQDFKSRVKNGGYTRKVAQPIRDAAERIHLLSPGSGTPWVAIEAAARNLHRRGKLDVLVVDYFTLMEPPQIGKQFSSAAMYGAISKAGKRLAHELSIAVIFVAQFSRQMREIDQEPIPSDLKETGQLEQDADWALFMWQASRKLSLLPKAHPGNRVSSYKKAKNRWGPVDFSGDGLFLEIDPTRDLILPYVRTTDGSDASAVGGGYDRL